MTARGAVAAGHPLTAEAGARVLRDGGNAVDAAIAAVLTSFVTESPLTGPGAGGYMLVHAGEDTPAVLDFFVAVPGADGAERGAELVPTPIHFTAGNVQTFNVGPASCGVPGTPAGLAAAAESFGSVPLGELGAPAAELARDGVEINPEQAYFIEILAPILTATAEGAALYAPGGNLLGAGDTFRFPELGDAIERLGAEGIEPFYRGEVAAALADWVRDRGGTLGRDDLAAYEPQRRHPVQAEFRGRRLFTNAPPSSGGVLIAFALDVLERLGRSDTEAVVAAMEAAQAARSEDFVAGLREEGFAERFLSAERAAAAVEAIRAGRRPEPGSPPGGRLGSTTHITTVDERGWCASVTCSNGTGSGVIVPGTGVHVNNMLGEQDLNPLGFHLHPPGVRLPSMMSPSILLLERELVSGLGSGGSNRIRSAVLQTVLRLVADEELVADAVVAPRVHYENGVVEAEPGISEDALRALQARGYEISRWGARNVFFGGVHAVTRNPDTGELGGGGDPRRGGAVAFA